VIILLGRLDVDPARLAGLKPVLQQTMRRARAEDGCYSCSLSVEDEGDGERSATIHISERWKSVAHLKAHAASAHMAEFRKAIAGAVRGSDIRMYDATNERPLKLR